MLPDASGTLPATIISMKLERLNRMVKLTKSVVDAAKPKDKDYFVWDGDLPGFGLRVYPTGRKFYQIQYRSNGRTRRYKIGLHGPITPSKAREIAIDLLGQINSGFDPSATKAARKDELTVSQLCDLYLEEGCGTKKASTIATDRGRIDRHIKPLIGHLPIVAVRKSDITKFLDDIAKGKTRSDQRTKVRGRAIVSGGKGTATRTVGLFGGIFTFAVDKGLIQINPVRGVKRFADKRNERFLTIAELGKLGSTLSRAEDEGVNPNAINAIKLLVMTGCRKSEILTLEWSFIDWGQKSLRLPDSKDGQKTIPLADDAIKLLKSIPKTEGNPYVLAGSKPGSHFSGLQKIWAAIRKWEGLDDVRIHDLRHSFASIAVQSGSSLPIIGKILGHADPKTTQRYAHLGESVVHEVVDQVAKQIDEAMSPTGLSTKNLSSESETKIK